MKILLATDGSSDSALAAETLVSLRPPARSEIHVIHVMEPPQYWVTPAVPASYQHEWHKVQHEMHAELEEAATRAVEQAERIVSKLGAPVHLTIIHGHPAEEIVLKAKDIDADLVVVGSKGLTGSQLFLLGSVSQRVVKYAPCSVLLTKHPQVGVHGISKVILATDGSENATAAAKFLSSFRMPEKTEIVILHVDSPEPHGLLSSIAHPPIEDLRRLRKQHGESIVEGTGAFLAKRFRTTPLIREGHAAEQILKAGSEMSADLIVMGSKGQSAAGLFLLGSVSQRVCRYSDISVLLVKSHTASPAQDGG